VNLSWGTTLAPRPKWTGCVWRLKTAPSIPTSVTAGQHVVERVRYVPVNGAHRVVTLTCLHTAIVSFERRRVSACLDPAPAMLRRLSPLVTDGERIKVPNVPVDRSLLQEAELELPADVLGGMVGWVDYGKHFARKRLASADK
jgi:hypothetical protein